MRRSTVSSAAVLALAVAACSEVQAPAPTQDDVPLTAALAPGGGNVLDQLNESLVGADYAISMVEIYTDPESGEMGTVIFANNRGNKQLAGDFVPADPRRGARTNIVYVVDEGEGSTASGLTAASTTAAIDAAMSTWDGVQCSNIPIFDAGPSGIDVGVVQALFGMGGNLNLFTDLMHAGWLPAPFFEALRTGGSTSILGVTFTFNWIDGAGTPTDIDGNGKADVAFREIYYNDNFLWRVDGGHVDVETVALHEAGHGLSQGHFGKIFGSVSNGKIHFAPRAVMNASYSGIQREIGKTDNAGHCSNWGAWPNN